jgi:hypothetical protein
VRHKKWSLNKKPRKAAVVIRETDGWGNKKLLPLPECCKTPRYSVQYELITRENPKEMSLLMYAAEPLG